MITSSIQAGVIYQVAVSAYNEVGEGERSDVLNIMAATVPSAVQEVKMVSQSGTAIKIQWTTPDDGGTPLTTYKIYSDQATNTFVEIIPSTGVVNTFTIDAGLVIDSVYRFKV